MSAFSDYYENKIIDHMLRNQAFTPPAAMYLALFTAVTGLEANNPTAEVSGGAYTRKVCALDAAAGGVTANTSLITFPTATASWGTVTHWALVDHETNDTWGTDVNVLLWGELDSPKVVEEDDIPTVNIGALDVEVA